MFTIVDDSKEKRKYRTDNGAWIPKLYPGYNLCSFSVEVDAEIAKNMVENRERKSGLKVMRIKEVKASIY